MRWDSASSVHGAYPGLRFFSLLWFATCQQTSKQLRRAARHMAGADGAARPEDPWEVLKNASHASYFEEKGA